MRLPFTLELENCFIVEHDYQMWDLSLFARVYLISDPNDILLFYNPALSYFGGHRISNLNDNCHF